ncbi:MAG: ABC-2 type transport system permease protein, partial [Ilumatobacter sp.]
VIIVGLMFGARPTHGPAGVLFLYVAAAGIAALGTGWGLGLAFRFRDMRAAAIMQLTFFLLIFLTDAQTPLFIMDGWLESVARINPFTNIIRLARLGFLDAPITWNNIWGGLVAIVAISALTLTFARRSLNRLSDS